jgi:hypothetical protein
MKPFIAILAVTLCLGLAGCGGGSASSQVSTPPPTTPTSQPIQMEVLHPPTSGQQYGSDVQQYLMSNPVVSGANFFVEWAVVDQGPSANPEYDFSSYDNDMQPWIAAGKKVNLIVWAVADSTTNTSTPTYVLNNLGSANTTICNTSEVTPNYFSPDFQTPYKAFMQAVVQHYTGNSSIGYIRFGLAQGGETYPNLGFDSEPTCSNAFASWGWTATTWTNYLTSMLDYEATLNSPIQLMVGINTVNQDTSIPDAVAADAVSHKIGFGSQGFQISDVASYNAGTPCIADWCALFDKYQGQVPLELQTATQSDPSGTGLTGSLTTLLPFAVQRHATILELYWEDWLTAFDPSYPGYTSAYATTIQSTATGQ